MNQIKTALYVPAMDCGEEVAAIERALADVSGIAGLKADIPKKQIVITHESGVTADNLRAAIGKAGLKTTLSSGGDENQLFKQKRLQRLLVGVSGAALGFGLLIPGLGETVQKTLFLAATLSAGALVFPKGIRAALSGRLDMNVLMTVAVCGALYIGEWSEAAAVVFLFALSELLETYSISRARKAIESLLKIVPETALVKRQDSIVEVPATDVRAGETVIIKSGSRIPLDGEVIRGQSNVNQAPITGESMPAEKVVGDPVFAGTINGEGSLEVRVTKEFAESTLAKIIHLVEEAQSEKAPSQRLVDTFARYYTPTIFVLALLVVVVPPLFFSGQWSDWLYRGLVLLVIACPCALVIATPVSIVSGLTAMARRGVLIKGGAHLEAIGKLRAIALDKTGTLTEGKPTVLEVVSLNNKPVDEIVRIAASIDAHSEHPLAQAVVSYAKEKSITFPASERYQSKSGRGAEAEVDGHPYFVGNHRLTHELAVCSPEIEAKLASIESQARSVVVVGHKPHPGCPGEVLGILAVGDAIRPNARDAIKSLRDAGIVRVEMLSGDNKLTAEAIGKEVGVDEAIGDLLPDQKIDRVKKLLAEHKFVGMVGDGVNDAPALAAATVGIAMGAIGTDTAIETADIALMHDDLSRLAQVVRTGRRTLGIIRANITFAITVKLIFLLLAFFGATSLWLAILADTGATLLVIANALRLLRA